MHVTEKQMREAADQAKDWRAVDQIRDGRIIAPGETPFEHLAHTLSAFASSPDEHMQIQATSNLFRSGTSGLTWGDLRAIHAELVQLREENAAYAAAYDEMAGV